ncbi:MAG: hypothetical protein JWQ88_1332 [Rhodoferax sp.]|nr:hypothetical protein [Rhodoferax sp.]
MSNATSAGGDKPSAGMPAGGSEAVGPRGSGTAGQEEAAAFRVAAVDAPQLTLERGRYLEAVFTASLLNFFGSADALRRAWDDRTAAPDAWAQAETLAYGDVAAKLTDKEAAMLEMKSRGGARFEVRWTTGT